MKNVINWIKESLYLCSNISELNFDDVVCNFNKLEGEYKLLTDYKKNKIIEIIDNGNNTESCVYIYAIYFFFMDIDYFGEKFYETLLKVNISIFKNFYDIVNPLDEDKKINFAEKIISNLIGRNITVDIFLLSFIVKLTNKDRYLLYMQEMILATNDFDYKQLFFLQDQINISMFLNQSLKSNNCISNNWKILNKATKLCECEINAELSLIPKEERNQELAIVITSQFLLEQHGPTKTALDRCYVLRKILNKNVLLINTAETSSEVGYVPFFEAYKGNYISEFMERATVEWRGETFSFYQSENIMPDIAEFENILEAVRSLKPSMVVGIGGGGILVGLINKLIPVMSVGLTQSGLCTTMGEYQVVDTTMIESIKPILDNMALNMNHIIPGRFTFSLKPQTEFLTRSKLSLPEDAFIMAVVGGRLGHEVTDDFLNMLEDVINPNIMIVLIGSCNDFEEKLSRHPMLSNNMKYLGFCDDILSRLELCDLYINPIRSGGGTSAVEAMFKSKPVVSVNYGDVAGIVGERFCCENYEEMAKLITRYYQDKKFYREQAAYARQLSEVWMDSEGEFVRIIEEYQKRENYCYRF